MSERISHSIQPFAPAALSMLRIRWSIRLHPGYNSFDDRTYLRFIVEEDEKPAECENRRNS